MKRVEVRDSRCPGDDARAGIEPGREAGLRQRIVDLAAREWEAFRFPVVDIAAKGLPLVPSIETAAGRGRPRPLVPARLNPPREGVYTRRMLRVGYAEDSPEAVLRVAGYWAAVPRQGAVSIQNAIWAIAPEAGWVQPWSAAFVSWVMCEAGLSEARFARAEGHAAYLHALFERPEGAAFTPMPLETAPEPGDLVCAGRADTPDLASLPEMRRAAASRALMHCDIVVGRAPDRLFVIGGNVENAVALTVLPVERGRVKATPHRRWFGVMRLRAPADERAGLARVGFACLGRPDVERCLDEL